MILATTLLIIIALIYIIRKKFTFNVDKESKSHGGQLIAKTLKAHNVSHVFTLCGGHISPILVGCKENNIEVVSFRDERNAAFAAEAHSKFSGRIGVAVITAGPGVTNTITSIQTARMSESPLLLIGGASPSLTKNRGALQDIDQEIIMRSICKKTYIIKRVKDIVNILREAIKVASSNLPGPVFVEVPINILYPYQRVYDEVFTEKSSSGSFITQVIRKYLELYIEYTFHDAFNENYRDYNPLPLSIPMFNDSHLHKVVHMIKDCRKPVIVAGTQILHDLSNVSEISHQLNYLNIPVYSPGFARGIMKDSLHGFRLNRINTLRNADFILLLGVTCDFRLKYGSGFNRNAKIVAVNLDESKMKMNQGVFWRSDLNVLASPSAFLLAFSKMIPNDININFNEWINFLSNEEEKFSMKIKNAQVKQESVGLNPITLLNAINEVLDERSIIICDGGDFVGTASNILKPRAPLRWLDAGPFGSLGTGAGYCIGAHTVYKNNLIWLIYGDGACGFSLNEFYTFAQLNVPVIAVIGNDGCWSQIERAQFKIFGDSVSCDLKRSNYHMVAEAFECKGILLSDKSQNEGDIIAILNQAKSIALNGVPVVINAFISKTNLRDNSISV